ARCGLILFRPHPLLALDRAHPLLRGRRPAIWRRARPSLTRQKRWLEATHGEVSARFVEAGERADAPKQNWREVRSRPDRMARPAHVRFDNNDRSSTCVIST